MYYSDLVKKAALICFDAHKNDFDKSGYPYVMHPMYLAYQFDDEESCCVALLHDVIEDHSDLYSFEYLEKEGFGSIVIDALKLLTHDINIEYKDYIKSISKNEIARNVKLADLKHNTTLSRLNGIKPPKYDIYKWSIDYLEGNDLE